MRRLDAFSMGIAIAAACACACVGSYAAAQPAQRHRAAISVEQPAAFVKLPLPVAVYARSAQADLADLRVVDANGERVPFALLAPRPDDVQSSDRWRDATLYRLPARPPAGGTWASPVDVTVEGGRMTVRQRGAAPAPAKSPGWLFDLGERAKGEAPAQTLQLSWSGPAEFSAPLIIEHSADLRSWRAAGSGQLLALASPSGALTQPDIVLPPDCERFVRLVWVGPGPQPQLSAARAATPALRSVTLDPPTEINVAASTEPAGPQAGEDSRRALHFDLGAVLPLQKLDLNLPAGTRVLPLRVQARDRIDAPWQPVAATVVYRIERGEQSARSPALALQRSARFIRLIPDERAAMPKAEEAHLVVQAQLASLVFAAQGQAPYALLAGAAKASAGALPLATLVPDVDQERARLGKAALGPFSEVREAVEKAESEERQAKLRPWLLWAVLIAGVAGLGWMVWRLARGGKG